jgi:hypothetical protein
MVGEDSSCRVLLPLDRKPTLTAPTRTSAISSVQRFGATAAAAITTANCAAELTSDRIPVRPRAAM